MMLTAILALFSSSLSDSSFVILAAQLVHLMPET
jgi:hypothetical protein